MFHHHQLLFLSSAVLLVSAQGPPPPASASGCTSKSFMQPSWLVDSFKVASSSDVSFHVFNRANNATANVACKVSGKSWSACTVSEKLDLDASVQLDGTTANLKVNETWTCKDREGSERLNFSASGSSAIALTGTGELASKNPVILLRGTLSSPVSAQPAYLEGPTGHDTPGCRATSQTPSWVVTSAHFEEQDGDGISSVPQTGMSLVMTNPSNGYQVSCMADNGFGGGEASPPIGGLLRLACAGYEFQSFTIGRYSLSTTASFDPATLKFTIGQTWYCDDTDPGRPVVIKAEASEILPLQCTNKKIQGDFTRRTCEADKEITVKGKLLSEDPLPAFSIEDPVPGADGCTVSSIFKPQWALSSFAIDGATGASTSNAGTGVISFNIILQTGTRGFQSPIAVSQGAAVPNSPGWYKCEVGPDGGIGQPLWPYDCTLRYNAESKELTLKADWACEDLDKEHPVHFSGVTSTIINSSITCESEDGLQRCHTADPGFSWVADIANVTVKAAP